MSERTSTKCLRSAHVSVDMRICQVMCKRVCVCIQGPVVFVHESLNIGLNVCGRVIPVQDGSEQGASSATPPVSSDFHH